MLLPKSLKRYAGDGLGPDMLCRGSFFCIQCFEHLYTPTSHSQGDWKTQLVPEMELLRNMFGKLPGEIAWHPPQRTLASCSEASLGHAEADTTATFVGRTSWRAGGRLHKATCSRLTPIQSKIYGTLRYGHPCRYDL